MTFSCGRILNAVGFWGACRATASYKHNPNDGRVGIQWNARLHLTWNHRWQIAVSLSITESESPTPRRRTGPHGDTKHKFNINVGHVAKKKVVDITPYTKDADNNTPGETFYPRQPPN